MRLTNLYQIFDIEAHKTAGAIFPEYTHAPAIRAFHQLFQQKNTIPADYPEHFVLRQVGTQDEETGEITPIEPNTVATGAGWIEHQRLYAQRYNPAETHMEHTQ